MEVFARVVEHGGFSAAARALGMTPSAVSKLISRLEARLGARLLHRSTRRISLTAEGVTFHERALRVLADLDEAEQAVGANAPAQERLRVNCNLAFGHHVLIPLIPDFLARHPGIKLDLTLADRMIDLLDERADVAIRTGPLSGAQLTARKLGQTRMALVAAPEYLRRHGAPRTPAELGRHNRIGFNFPRAVETWPFATADGDVELAPCGNANVSDGETARQLVLAGVGVARLARWHIAADVAAGRLVVLMEDLNPGDLQPIHAVYVGGRAHAPARVRTFIDYLAAHVRLLAA